MLTQRPCKNWSI